tara:strand:- start:5099 stop:5320 length:222 start_codon:yes stop_codon:yes gene_type:complete
MEQNTDKIKVFINGKKKSIPFNCTINEMLKVLSIDNISIAVAINRNVVPKEKHNTFIVEDDSSIEIINAVGGG